MNSQSKVYSRFSMNDVIIGNMMFGIRSNAEDLKFMVKRAEELGVREFDSSPSYIGGESDRLLSHCIKSEKIKDVAIHSKIGSRLGSISLRDWGLYKKLFEEKINCIKDTFSEIELGSLQLHCDFSGGNLEKAVELLINLQRQSQNFRSIGFCNLSRDFLGEFDKGGSFVLDEQIMEINHQQRFNLFVDDSCLPSAISNWAYGMLNGGAIIPKNRECQYSRINVARDREEINKRYISINSFIVNSCLQEK